MNMIAMSRSQKEGRISQLGFAWIVWGLAAAFYFLIIWPG